MQLWRGEVQGPQRALGGRSRRSRRASVTVTLGAALAVASGTSAPEHAATSAISTQLRMCDGVASEASTSLFFFQGLSRAIRGRW